MITFENESEPANKFIITTVDTGVEDKRQRLLDTYENFRRGERGQPPMIDRLAIVVVLVDYLEATGVPFATTHACDMNRAVREWLNERAGKSKDPRKSRRKKLTADAVQALLKQVEGLRFAAKR